MNSRIRTLVIVLTIAMLSAQSGRSFGSSLQSKPSQSASPLEMPADPVTTIPFTLTEFNNMIVKATINETEPVDLMFHTAASSVALTKQATERLASIQWDESETVKSWGGETQARISSKNSLQIGELSWAGISITEDEHSGKLSDGKFGPNLFENKIIEIDFDKQVLRLHSPLPAIDKYERLELVEERGNWFLKGRMTIGEKMYEREFLVHSGFGGTILLDDEFVSSNDLVDKLTTISESELKDSYGNVLKTKKVLLPSIEFGQVAFSDLPAGLFDGAIGRQKMSVMGGEILKRFNMIVDLRNGCIYLKPNALFEAAFSD